MSSPRSAFCVSLIILSGTVLGQGAIIRELKLELSNEKLTNADRGKKLERLSWFQREADPVITMEATQEAIAIVEPIHHPSLLGSAITRKVAAKQTGYDHVPVAAGITGVKKSADDTRGETVNTASRIESSDEVGQVKISEATYALVNNGPGLTFTPRGKVQAHGKGAI